VYTALGLLPLGHELLVEFFDLADVVLHTRTQSGHSKVIRSLLLTESRSSNGADTRGIWEGSALVLNPIAT
jgi:hypothetical protein